MEEVKKEQVHLFMGLDLGKRQDYSALAVVEYRRCWTERRSPVTWAMEPVQESEAVTFLARQLARIPLGTRYTDVAFTVGRVLERAAKKWDCTLVVDATGVGQPVVEMFQGLPPRASMVAVVITAAGGESKVKDEWRVPKKDLLAGLQVMLETDQLAIAADLEFAPALQEELMELRASGESANGAHDDLVMALALALWRARKMIAASAASGAGRPGFRNNAFGQAIYGVGSSPWNWPARPGAAKL